jgi:hypothetical protein
VIEGSGSRRLKNMWIRIRICNTVFKDPELRAMGIHVAGPSTADLHNYIKLGTKFQVLA